MISLLEKTTDIHLLYDFYGVLLTEKQRFLIELYYHEDWSLGEIAEHQEVSRQAVFLAVKRAVDKLYEFEEKLQMKKRHFQYRERLEKLMELLPEDALKAKALLEEWLKEEGGE